MAWDLKAKCKGSKATKCQDNGTKGGKFTSQVVNWI